jgi:hypothetical protein
MGSFVVSLFQDQHNNIIPHVLSSAWQTKLRPSRVCNPKTPRHPGEHIKAPIPEVEVLLNLLPSHPFHPKKQKFNAVEDLSLPSH